MRESADIPINRLCIVTMSVVDRRLSKPLARELEQTAQVPVFVDAVIDDAARVSLSLPKELLEVRSRRRRRRE